jgi:hypothetical protein
MKTNESQILDEEAGQWLSLMPVPAMVAAACGHIDLNGLAIEQLASRGLDPSTGKWIGFEAAHKRAAEMKAALGVL